MLAGKDGELVVNYYLLMIRASISAAKLCTSCCPKDVFKKPSILVANC